MFDFYSAVPVYVIYLVGGIFLLLIIWSLLRDAAIADSVTRKKLIKIYAWLLLGSLAIVFSIKYFDLPEKLFPSFYTNEELRQQNPWKQNFKFEEWELPFEN